MARRRGMRSFWTGMPHLLILRNDYHWKQGLQLQVILEHKSEKQTVALKRPCPTSPIVFQNQPDLKITSSRQKAIAQECLNLGSCESVVFGGINTSSPIGSMYGIFTYMYHNNQPNVDKKTIHGSYGFKRSILGVAPIYWYVSVYFRSWFNLLCP